MEGLSVPIEATGVKPILPKQPEAPKITPTKLSEQLTTQKSEASPTIDQPTGETGENNVQSEKETVPSVEEEAKKTEGKETTSIEDAVEPVEEALKPVEKAVTPVPEAYKPVEGGALPIREAVLPAEGALSKEEIKMLVNKSWKEAMDLVLSAYETDPVKVAEQLNIQVDNPAEDEKVKAEIEKRKKSLEEKPELKEAIEVIKRADNIRLAAEEKIKKEGKTGEEAEEIRKEFYDKNKGIYYELNKDGNPIKEKPVRLSLAIKPVVDELETQAKAGIPQKDTAQTLNYILNDRMTPDGAGGYYFNIEPIKGLTPEQKAELKKAIETAKTAIAEEFGNIICSKEELRPEVMWLARVARCVNAENIFAQPVVSASLPILERRLNLTSGVSEARKNAVRAQIKNLRRFPQENENLFEMVNQLAAKIPSLGDQNWDQVRERIIQTPDGEARFNIICSEIANVVSLAEKHKDTELPGEVNEFFKGVISEEFQETIFDVNTIVDEIGKQENNQEYVKEHEEEVKERVEYCLPDENENGDWKGKAFGLVYLAFLLLQIVQGTAEKESRAGVSGPGEGGGGGQ